MATVIQQSVAFEGVSATRLYTTYIDADRHAAALGAPARISPTIGSEFAIFGDSKVRGKMLAVVPERMVAQSWRGAVWRADEPDSLLVLVFTDGAIHLTQAGVPPHAYDIIAGGWDAMYWAQWRAYFGS